MQLRPEYCLQAPSTQTMIDILRESWVSSFPKEMGLIAGTAPHFEEDPRVSWANSKLPNGVRGMSVLELGPLEAYHTYQLEQFGAGPIVSVESNNLSFLKCLIVKELFGLNATFLYGDCIKYLESTTERFGLCWASGLLYHSTDPLYLLALLQERSDTLFIWTHYFDETVMSSIPGLIDNFDLGKTVKAERMGFRATYAYRNYPDDKGAAFSGGGSAFSYWMPKEDILGFLKSSGFHEIIMGLDHPHNPNGPAMFFIVRR